jgi:hypothetical protein
LLPAEWPLRRERVRALRCARSRPWRKRPARCGQVRRDLRPVNACESMESGKTPIIERPAARFAAARGSAAQCRHDRSPSKRRRKRCEKPARSAPLRFALMSRSRGTIAASNRLQDRLARAHSHRRHACARRASRHKRQIPRGRARQGDWCSLPCSTRCRSQRAGDAKRLGKLHSTGGLLRLGDLLVATVNEIDSRRINDS